MGKARKDGPAKPMAVELVGEEYMPRIYANFCQLRTSPYDVSMVFGEMAPGTETQQTEAQKSGKIKGRAKAVIAIPHQMVPGLVQALQTVVRAQKEAQERQRAQQEAALAAGEEVEGPVPPPEKKTVH
ncbi:MAG: DUF3467 domain-containing protein [Planctomycetes bacterium]|nr:DUF3467 domain-containing protein [Planctomycetota bacterium]